VLDDSLVLVSLFTLSMVVEDERFSASIITYEITEVFQNYLGWFFSYGNFNLVALVYFFKTHMFRKPCIFLKSLNITCITSVATITMIETGEGGVGYSE